MHILVVLLLSFQKVSNYVLQSFLLFTVFKTSVFFTTFAFETQRANVLLLLCLLIFFCILMFTIGIVNCARFSIPFTLRRKLFVVCQERTSEASIYGNFLANKLTLDTIT